MYQGVGVKLGLLQVRPTTADAPPDAAFHTLRKRYSVGALPEERATTPRSSSQDCPALQVISLKSKFSTADSRSITPRLPTWTRSSTWLAGTQVAPQFRRRRRA